MDEKFALPAAGPGLCPQNPAFLVKKYDITGRDRLLLPLTLAGHKLHLSLPTGSFFHLLVFLTLIGGALQQRREFLRPGQILRRVPAAGLPAGSPHLPSPHLISRIIAMEVLHHD